MYINKYLLMILGFIVGSILGVIINPLIALIWYFIFWLWYFNKKTYTKGEIEDER